MRDMVQIVEAFENLCREGKPAALATVAVVEGSSYRSPGSRLLIAADGRTWGNVSGGCLERDLARRGRIVIDTSQPQNCCYETGEEGEEIDAIADPGPTLGCGGRIDILVERVSTENPGPIAAMQAAVRSRQCAQIGTIVRVDGDADVFPGQRIMRIGRDIQDDLENDRLRRTILADWAKMRSPVQCLRMPIGGGSADILLERITPPQSLAIFGQNHDALVLAEFARLLGWHVRLISRRADSEYPELEDDAAAVVMEHHLRRDIAALRWLLRKPPKYIGILGPRHRTRRILAAVGAENLPDEIRQRLFWPIGLDIGSAGPEQIALAIAAEILAVMSGCHGGSLRDRSGPIHIFSSSLQPK
jgi:xanthine dehydrogenase accessory factor